jgi:hypothetical protein
MLGLQQHLMAFPTLSTKVHRFEILINLENLQQPLLALSAQDYQVEL